MQIVIIKSKSIIFIAISNPVIPKGLNKPAIQQVLNS